MEQIIREHSIFHNVLTTQNCKKIKEELKFYCKILEVDIVVRKDKFFICATKTTQDYEGKGVVESREVCIGKIEALVNFSNLILNLGVKSSSSKVFTGKDGIIKTRPTTNCDYASTRIAMGLQPSDKSVKEMEFVLDISTIIDMSDAISDYTGSIGGPKTSCYYMM